MDSGTAARTLPVTGQDVDFKATCAVRPNWPSYLPKQCVIETLYNPPTLNTTRRHGVLIRSTKIGLRLLPILTRREFTWPYNDLLVEAQRS